MALKINADNTLAVAHSRDFYRGRSFRFAGEWKPGTHYLCDDYVVDFVSYDSVLLACIKSHMSSDETEPYDFLYSDIGACVGINSEYWAFVLSGYSSDSGGSIPDYYLDKLNALNISCDTTENWNNKIGYIPKKGEIVIYSDYSVNYVNGNRVEVPAIKIGSGNGYVQDLAFVGDDDREAILSHIRNDVIHITAEERQKWNNKLNVTDGQEVIEETLIFNRR